MASVKPFNSDKKTINILIVDDHQMVRQGLKKMLLSLNGPFIIKTTEAESGKKAIEKLNQKNYDLVFMDYQMPGNSGLETTNQILRFKPHQKIIVLSNYDQLAYVESVRNAGAMGYLLKNIESAELLKALTRILQGKVYYSNDIMLKLVEAKEQSVVQENKIKSLLTKRETEVLRLIANELTNHEIGKELFISPKTVQSHRQNLLIKLGVNNTVGLVKKAFKMKLID